MKAIPLGHIAGLELSAGPSVWISLLALWAALAAGAAVGLKFSMMEAVVGGLAATALHLLSELIHQFGHAIAARRTGHPMTGVRLWGVLAGSVYPSDEPELPPATHIRRALGGAPISAIVALFAGAVAWLFQPVGGLAWALAVFMALDNLLVFAIGAFLPLGFTDGSTILRYLKK